LSVCLLVVLGSDFRSRRLDMIVGRADSSDNEEKYLNRTSHANEHRAGLCRGEDHYQHLISSQMRRFPKAGPIIIGRKKGGIR
jgi:hypothetical protein